MLRSTSDFPGDAAWVVDKYRILVLGLLTVVASSTHALHLAETLPGMSKHRISVLVDQPMTPRSGANRPFAADRVSTGDILVLDRGGPANRRGASGRARYACWLRTAPLPAPDQDCAEAQIAGDQETFVNRAIAALGLTIVARLCQRKLTWRATFFDLDVGSLHYTHADPHAVAGLMGMRIDGLVQRHHPATRAAA